MRVAAKRRGRLSEQQEQNEVQESSTRRNSADGEAAPTNQSDNIGQEKAGGKGTGKENQMEKEQDLSSETSVARVLRTL